MRAQIASAGFEISSHQIERWRRQELLPKPTQEGLGRGLGSRVWVPPESGGQAIEIFRFMAIREKRDWVGWQLWMRGYPVGERYWRPAIDDALATLRHAQKAAKQFERRLGGTDVHAFKAGVLRLLAGTPLAAPLARIDPEMVETVVGFAAEILLGKFNRFTPETAEPSIILNLLGALAGEGHSIAGHSIEFRGAIETVLKDMSKAIGHLLRRKSIKEPSPEIRREFAQIFGIGTIIYAMISPLLGRRAMGLGTLNEIARRPDIGLQAAMLLIWSELRENSGLLRPGSEISGWHGEAIEAWKMAQRFWEGWWDAAPDLQAQMVAKLKEQIPIPKRVKSIRRLAELPPNFVVRIT